VDTLFNNQVVVLGLVLLDKADRHQAQRNQQFKYKQVDLTQQQSLDIFNENISRFIKSN
jgi:hypothetical protein